MRRLTAVLMAGIMVLTTLTGSLTAFADTEIDQTAPVIHSLTFQNADNLNGVSDSIHVEIDITEEGSGLSELTLYFGEKDFRYEGSDYEDDEACGNDPLLFSGKHKLSFSIGNRLDIGTHQLTAIEGRDRNGNQFYMDQEAIQSTFYTIPTINVIYAEREMGVFELESFQVLDAKNLDTADKLRVKFTFSGNLKVNGIHLTLWEEGADGSAGQLDIVMGEFNELKAGTHIVEFNLDDLFPKGVYYVYSIDFERGLEYQLDKSEDTRICLTSGKDKISDPVLHNIRMHNKEITAPEVLKMDVDAEDDGKPLNYISITFEDKNGRDHTFDGTLKKKNGKYIGEIPIGPFITEGKLTPRVICIGEYLDDKNRFERHTAVWVHENEWLLEEGRIRISSGYNITYFGSLGNKRVPEILRGMKSGQTAVLDCRNYKNVSKEIFEAIAGRDIKVALIDENVQWVFNGKSIKKSKCKKINVSSSIKVVSGVTEGFPDDKKVAKLIFRDNGELPGKVEMRINYDYLAIRYKFNKENLRLTYLSPTNPVLEDSNVDMAEDQYYEYDVDHNSTFVLSKGKAKLGATTVHLDSNNMKGVKIKWQKKSGNGYYIYRSTSKGGPYKKIATIKKPSTASYVDKNTVCGKNYYYKVKPYSKKTSYNKTAKMSQPCKAYTKLKPSRIYSAHFNKKKTKVMVEWSYNAKAKKYEVYRATKESGVYKRIATTEKTYVTDKNVKKGKVYYYKVKAIYKSGSKMNSNFSKIKSTED